MGGVGGDFAGVLIAIAAPPWGYGAWPPGILTGGNDQLLQQKLETDQARGCAFCNAISSFSFALEPKLQVSFQYFKAGQYLLQVKIRIEEKDGRCVDHKWNLIAWFRFGLSSYDFRDVSLGGFC
jgi:hypothetical protein